MDYIKLSKVISNHYKTLKTFQKERWKRGLHCSKCGCTQCHRHSRLKNGLQKYRCYACKHVFSDMSRTVLKNSKSPPESWIIIFYESNFKSTCREIAQKASVNKNTAWRLLYHCRRYKQKLNQNINQLNGTIEIDETKLNGEWYLGLIERNGNLIIEKVPNRSAFILSQRIEKYVYPNSTIMTDEWGGYFDLEFSYYQYRHFTVKHAEYFVHPELKTVHTNTIESVWKHLKRKINHLHHGPKQEYLRLYIDEFLYHKNHKHIFNLCFFPLSCDILKFVPPLTKT